MVIVELISLILCVFLIGLITGFVVMTKFVVPDVIKRLDKSGHITINRSVSGGKL